MAVTHRLHRRDRRATSAIAARTKARPATSTSTRSIRRWRDSCSRSAAAGIAAKLRESVPNPFFGIAAAGEFGGRRRPFARGQLLRPFPEFGDVLHARDDDGVRNGNTTPCRSSWTSGSGRRTGGAARFSYTLSNSKDNQFGESNTYAWNTRLPQNNYDLARRVRARASTTRRTASSWRRSSGSAARRITAASPTLLLGGWNASAIVELVSGAPLNAVISSRHVGCQPGSLRRPSAAQPDRRSEHDGQRRRPRSSARTRTRATSTRRRSQTPASASTATHRARSTRALPVPQEHRPGVREGDAVRRRTVGRDPLRDPEPDEYGEVRQRVDQQRDQYVEFRPHRDAGRLHAHLAADVPLPVLDAPHFQRRPSLGGAAAGRLRAPADHASRSVTIGGFNTL